MPNRPELRRTNPNRIVYFAFRVLAANFKKTYFIFCGNRGNNNYYKESNHGLNRRTRELTIQVV